MKTRNTITSLFTAAILALTFSACSDSSSSSSEATIRGSIDSESTQSSMQKTSDEGATMQSVRGVTVFAAQVSSNGSIQAIEGTQTTTNASGQFTINMDVSAAQHIVIVAEQGGEQWMGHLSAFVENGSTYTLKPSMQHPRLEHACIRGLLRQVTPLLFKKRI